MFGMSPWSAAERFCGSKLARAKPARVVVRGEADVEQPLSAYIFPGQGSQEVGMGMELYAQSRVAAEIWDRADRFLADNYGKLTHDGATMYNHAAVDRLL